MKKKYILLDRDGTIIVDKNYPSHPDQIELLPNASEGLRRMQSLGFGLIVISNQSGIGRGYFTVEQLQKVHERFLNLLKSEGIVLDGLYFCPHAPQDNCTCRKPETGMVDQARKVIGFNPDESFVIGDKAADVQLADNIGAKSILVRTGYGVQTEKDSSVKPDFVVDNLWEASEILGETVSG